MHQTVCISGCCVYSYVLLVHQIGLVVCISYRGRWVGEARPALRPLGPTLLVLTTAEASSGR